MFILTRRPKTTSKALDFAKEYEMLTKMSKTHERHSIITQIIGASPLLETSEGMPKKAAVVDTAARNSVDQHLEVVNTMVKNQWTNKQNPV